MQIDTRSLTERYCELRQMLEQSNLREIALRERNNELERENAALREDKQRLDWLETQDCWIGVCGEYDISAHIQAGSSYCQKVRAAIDAARKEAKP